MNNKCFAKYKDIFKLEKVLSEWIHFLKDTANFILDLITDEIQEIIKQVKDNFGHNYTYFTLNGLKNISLSNIINNNNKIK